MHKELIDSANGRTKFEIIVHPSHGASRVVVNVPGYNGHIDGFNLKYRTLGAHLSDQGRCAFVQMPNISDGRVEGKEYALGLINDLWGVLHWLVANANSLGVTRGYELCLSGFSAGGFAVAAVAPTRPQVKKILLMEPSASAGLFGGVPWKSMAQFRGEVSIVIGDRDGVGCDVGQAYYDAFSSAAFRRIRMIENCDHQFKGRENGQIVANAPGWAFWGEPKELSSDDGLILY